MTTNSEPPDAEEKVSTYTDRTDTPADLEALRRRLTLILEDHEAQVQAARTRGVVEQEIDPDYDVEHAVENVRRSTVDFIFQLPDIPNFRHQALLRHVVYDSIQLQHDTQVVTAQAADIVRNFPVSLPSHARPETLEFDQAWFDRMVDRLIELRMTHKLVYGLIDARYAEDIMRREIARLFRLAPGHAGAMDKTQGPEGDSDE